MMDIQEILRQSSRFLRCFEHISFKQEVVVHQKISNGGGGLEGGMGDEIEHRLIYIMANADQ